MSWFSKFLQSIFGKSKPRPATPMPSPTQPRATLAVVVTNSRTNEPVAGATFRFNDVLRTTTNESGYAALEAGQGDVYFAIEHPDFHEIHDKVLLTQNTQLAVNFEPTAPVVVPAAPVVYPKLRGQLRIEANRFVDDSGPVLPVFAHAGDIFALYKRNPALVYDQLDKMAAAGYQGFRFWTILGGEYWEKPDRHIGPKYFGEEYYVLLKSFMQEAHARGLRLVASQGDIGQLGNIEQRKAFARRFAQIAREVDGTGHLVAFFDGGNEAWQTGEPDPQRLAQFVQAYRDAGGTALLTLSSPPGEDKKELDDFSIDPAQCYDVHGYRGGRAYDKIRHIFSLPYEGKPNRKLGIQSEPPGNGALVSVTDNKQELNHEAVALLGLMSLICRQAWVWFSGEGVRIQAGLETEQGFAATPKAAAFLPSDVMSFSTLHHSGDTWSSIRIVDRGVTHESRVDGVQHSDGRVVYLFYGEPGTHTFRAAKNFSGQLIHPATGESHPLSVKAGETFSLDWQWGRLFIGKIG